jgi:transcriptional regulator with XRE-family HTH domain
MAHIGELLRAIRLEWGLTLREVMHRSQVLAGLWGSPTHVVSYGHLAKVEKGEHDLTVDKFFSLSEIYSRSPDTILRAYRPQRLVTSFSEQLGGPNATHIVTEGRLGEHARQLLPDQWDSAPPPILTSLLTADSADRRRYRRIIVGKNDLTLFPLIRPGSILKIDTHKRSIASRKEWFGEFDRPIYLLYTRDGYMCSWCELDDTGTWLTTVPHVCSKTAHRHLRYGNEVEVIGRAVGLIMNLETDA